MKIFFFFAFVLFLGGCSTANPFKQEKLQDVAGINPILIRDEFAKKIPEKLQIVSSVSFKNYWYSFYSLGYLKRNLAKNSFTLVALDPAGVRLFKIIDNDGNIEYSSSINELKKSNSFVNYIAEDIKNVYFNNMPSDNAVITKNENKIIFTEPRRDEKIEYRFGGKNNNLLEKVLLRKRGWFWRIFMDDYYSVWSVGYYGYKDKNGKLYPINIYYQNNALNYQLIFRLKEIM